MSPFLKNNNKIEVGRDLYPDFMKKIYCGSLQNDVDNKNSKVDFCNKKMDLK